MREKAVQAPPGALWEIIEGIGGRRGWYSWPLAWRARIWLDRVAGGTGLRRGGHLYRRLLLCLHAVVFSAMARNITRAAQRQRSSPGADVPTVTQ